MSKIPKPLEKLQSNSPDVWAAYEKLGEACAKAGPLGARSRRLIKLALAVGLGSEGAVHSHVRRALDERCTPAEINHVALLAIPTKGLPRSVAALSWIGDILTKT
jgi:alkylhydroperoxidase/carboxymuconolactone decarboxylase family protein YurZ